MFYRFLKDDSCPNDGVYAVSYGRFTVTVCFHLKVKWSTAMVSGVPRNFFRGGGSTNSVDRGQTERGSGGGSPLVRGSGGSCNLVQEI